MAEGRAIRLSREVQLADELAGVRAALSAYQEELARVNAFAAEIAQDATDALVARDELARAIKEHREASRPTTRLGRDDKLYRALSSEATKGARSRDHLELDPPGQGFGGELAKVAKPVLDDPTEATKETRR